MKKAFLAIVVIALTSVVANAQQTIELNYYKMIMKEKGKWGKWDSKWELGEFSNGKNQKFVVKKIDDKTFATRYISAWGDNPPEPFETVVYDPVKTEQIREKNSNPNLTAYKKDEETYIWTDNFTLNELAEDSSIWTTRKKARFYSWTSDGALLYTSGGHLKPDQINPN